MQGRYGGAEGAAEQRARGEAARRRYEETGQVDYEPVVSPGDPPGVVGFFLNPDRGGIPQWSNRFAVLAWPEWLAFDSISARRRSRCRPCWSTASRPPTPKALTDSRPAARAQDELWTHSIQFDFYNQEPQVTFAAGAIIEHLHAAFER